MTGGGLLLHHGGPQDRRPLPKQHAVLAAVSPDGSAAVGRAVGERRVESELGRLLRVVGPHPDPDPQAQGGRVAVGHHRGQVVGRVGEAWLQARLVGGGAAAGAAAAGIVPGVADGIVHVLLADVGGVNELGWLLNCVSHDPLHERKGEIHCSAPASFRFPFF